MGLLDHVRQVHRTLVAANQEAIKLEAMTDGIRQKIGDRIMAKLKDFQDLLAAINTETDRLAAKIQALIDQVSASSLTGAEEDSIIAGMKAVKDRLSSVGADPADPIPAEPAPPTV